MDELELSEVMQHGDEGGQTVIVVQGQEDGETEVYPGFKFVSPAPQHHYASPSPCQKSMIYVTSGSEARRAFHGGESETLGLPQNVFTATPSGATFLPPTLEMRGNVAREEETGEVSNEQGSGGVEVENGEQSLAGTEISLMLGEEEAAREEVSIIDTICLLTLFFLFA